MKQVQRLEPSASSAADGVDIHTASKHLLEISPVPKIPFAFNRRMEQIATILTSEELISRRECPNKKYIGMKETTDEA
jgi:hypothetical protein